MNGKPPEEVREDFEVHDRDDDVDDLDQEEI
jgi:hypothetical protein